MPLEDRKNMVRHLEEKEGQYMETSISDFGH